MASRIRALCPTCRVIDVGVDDATLQIHGYVQEATCRLTCPGCRVTLDKPIPPPLAQLLIRAGVQPTFLEGAAEAAPPLTAADLLPFHRELETYASAGVVATPTGSTRLY